MIPTVVGHPRHAMIALAAGHSRHARTEDAAAAIFAVIGASSIEERESSNYAEGFSFRGYVNGLEVKVSRDSDHDELPLWIHFKGLDEEAVADTVAASVEGLKSEGFRLARIEAFGCAGEWLLQL